MATDPALGWDLKHRAFPEAKVARQGLLHKFIAIVEVVTEIDPPVRPNPGGPVEQQHRDGLARDRAGFPRLDDPVDRPPIPLCLIVQQ